MNLFERRMFLYIYILGQVRSFPEKEDFVGGLIFFGSELAGRSFVGWFCAKL